MKQQQHEVKMLTFTFKGVGGFTSKYSVGLEALSTYTDYTHHYSYKMNFKAETLHFNLAIVGI